MNIVPGDLVIFIKTFYSIGRIEEVKKDDFNKNVYTVYVFDNGKNTKDSIELNDRDIFKVFRLTSSKFNENIGAITLHNIDVSKISLENQYNKLDEERKEFDEALHKAIYSKTTGNIDAAISELLDEFQSGISLLYKTLGVNVIDIMNSYCKHEDKLKSRPRYKK